jgi:hypothetical protein
MLLLVVAVICGFLAGRMSAIRPLEAARREAALARKEAFSAIQEQLILRAQVIQDPALIGFGDDPQNDQCDAYWAQSFTAEKSKPKQLALLARQTEGQPRFRLLIVDFVDADLGVPGHVLFESDEMAILPSQSEGYDPLIIDLGDITLRAGQKYAFVLDAFCARDGIDSHASFLGAHHNRKGDFYSIRARDGIRSDHLERLFKEKYTDRGLAYRIVYE